MKNTTIQSSYPQETAGQIKINKINFTLSSVQILLHLYVFILVPVYFSSRPFIILNMLIVALLFTNQLWAIIHEGIHGLLSSNKKINNCLFSLLSICFGTSSIFLRAVHTFHHRYNRSHYELVELYDDTENKSVVTLSYYYNLFIGLYLSELFYPFLAILPVRALRYLNKRFFQKKLQLSKLIDHFISRPRELKILRLELAIVFCLYSLVFYLLSENWFILLGFLLLRGFLISFFDYIYHYETPVGNNLNGKNLELPKLLSKFLLHFNLHGIHHQNPSVSWVELPVFFKKKNNSFDAHYLSAAKDQLKGPINQNQLSTTK